MRGKAVRCSDAVRCRAVRRRDARPWDDAEVRNIGVIMLIDGLPKIFAVKNIGRRTVDVEDANLGQRADAAITNDARAIRPDAPRGKPINWKIPCVDAP
jgi:hypothetical protein